MPVFFLKVHHTFFLYIVIFQGPDFTETFYIATQGPMAHTCEDFWEMVWSTHVRKKCSYLTVISISVLFQCKCIVMLTGLIEKGRNKCELYFPLGKSDDRDEQSFYYVTTTKIRDKFTFDISFASENETEIHAFEELNEVSFGQFNVKFIEKKCLDECHIRKFEVEKAGSNEPRIIHHYWFSNWPDHKMASPSQILKIALDVLDIMDTYRKHDNNSSDISKSNDESLTNNLRNFNKSSKSIRDSSDKKHIRNGSSTLALFKKTSLQERRKSSETLKLPIIVHCSAGIGRTGCFLAILNGIQQLRNNKTVDVLAILCSLRLNRGGMVQTAEQYELIHRVLSLFAESLTQSVYSV